MDVFVCLLVYLFCCCIDFINWWLYLVVYVVTLLR